MRKMLHLVYTVWKTNRPFDDKHFAWEPPAPAAKTVTPEASAGAAGSGADQTKSSVDRASSPAASQHEPADNTASVTPSPNNKTAVGHKRNLPAEEVVTTANATVAPAPPAVKEATAANRAARPKVDFAFLREQVSMEQVLRHLSLLDKLRGRGLQRRGPCPLHGGPHNTQATFSAHLGKHIFQCFHADCRAQGNVLDLWAAVPK